MMGSMDEKTAEVLTVLIGGETVGTVTVTERTPLKVFGKFIPTAGLEPYRRVFEVAIDLARQFDAAPKTNEICTYVLWEQMVEACHEIGRLEPSFSELPSKIEEFALSGDWCVVVTLFSETP
jgi:hypothetical protein